jgi:hypothetical protein
VGHHAHDRPAAELAPRNHRRVRRGRHPAPATITDLRDVTVRDDAAPVARQTRSNRPRCVCLTPLGRGNDVPIGVRCGGAVAVVLDGRRVPEQQGCSHFAARRAHVVRVPLPNHTPYACDQVADVDRSDPSRQLSTHRTSLGTVVYRCSCGRPMVGLIART